MTENSVNYNLLDMLHVSFQKSELAAIPGHWRSAFLVNPLVVQRGARTPPRHTTSTPVYDRNQIGESSQVNAAAHSGDVNGHRGKRQSRGEKNLGQHFSPLEEVDDDRLPVVGALTG